MQEGNGWKGIYWWRIEKVTKFCYIFKIWSIKIEVLKLRDQNWNPVFEGGGGEWNLLMVYLYHNLFIVTFWILWLKWNC